jgi:hypothetical protein
MVAEEVISPQFSVEEANAPDVPDSNCVETQEEQMGILQTLDRLGEAVDAILKTKSAASSSTLQQNLKAKNSKKLNHCTICTKSFAKLETLKIHMRVHTGETLFLPSVCKVVLPIISFALTFESSHWGENPYLPPVYKVVFPVI